MVAILPEAFLVKTFVKRLTTIGSLGNKLQMTDFSSRRAKKQPPLISSKFTTINLPLLVLS
jgi:hypothetical protein